MKKDEMEFDKTRKAIDSGHLRSHDRKDMLNKLRGAGGEVLGERSIHDEEPDSGGQSRPAGGGRDIKLPSQIAREQRRKDSEKKSQGQKGRDSEEKSASNFFARLRIKFGCWRGGVTPFGQDIVTTRFMSKLNLELKRALMECNILATDLFLSHPETGKIIIKELDQRNPMYVEVIEKASDLYDRNQLNDLLSEYASSPNRPLPLSSIRTHLFALLRKLYYLKPYQESYLQAANAGIDIQQKTDKKSSSLYTSKKRRIKTDWNVLMNSIYPGLVLLAQRAEMKKAEPGTYLFEDMLGITPDDKLGQRKAGAPVGKLEKELSADQKKKEETKKEQEKLETKGAAQSDGTDRMDAEDEEADEQGSTVDGEDGESAELEGDPNTDDRPNVELNYGLKVMKMHPVSQLREKYAQKGEWNSIPATDKALVAYLYFRVFEDEFSFLLTSPKVTINTVYEDGVKKDLRQTMSDHSQGVQACYNIMKKYVPESDEYNSSTGDKSGADNYMEHTKRITNLENRLKSTSHQTRQIIKDYMNKICDTFKILIDDMKGDRTIVGNPDQALKFNTQLGENVKLNGKTVKECLIIARCYALALGWKIEKKELGGSEIQMSAEEATQIVE